MNPKNHLALPLIIVLQACITFPGLPAALAQVSPVKQQSGGPQAACALDQHASFFEQFTYGKGLLGVDRPAYTSAYVQLRNYHDPSKPLRVVSRKDYNGFKIRLIDYRWSFSEPSTVDNSPYTRLKLDVRKLDTKTFRVDYIRAQYQFKGGESEAEDLVKTYGEPGAYIFEHRNGCWSLTKELRSTRSASAQAVIAPPQAIDKLLSKNMPYADLRRIVMSKGWIPLVDPECKRNVGGTATICESSPELEACSGDGYCKMNFEHMSGGKKLSVGTYGRPALVRWWEIGKL